MAKTSLEKYQEVKELMKNGSKFREACEKIGVPPGTMSYYRTKDASAPIKKRSMLTRAKDKYKAIALEEPSSSGFELKGNPKQIAQFLKEMTNQFGSNQ